MTKRLYKFYLDCGRMGSLEGLFIEEESVVDAAMGKDAWYDEPLGKHSEIMYTLSYDEIEVVDVPEDFVANVEKYIGTEISGYNPVQTVLEQEGY